MKNLIIVGTGPTGVLVYDFVMRHRLFNVLGFAVNREYFTTDSFLGKPVYVLEDLKESALPDFCLYVAILWNKLNGLRRRLYEYCKGRGWEMASLISPLASVSSLSEIGEHVWLQDYVMVLPGVKIEEDVQVLMYSLVADNAHLEAHSHINVKVVVGGGCLVGEQSFVGMGAVLFDEARVGKKSIVGGGVVVKRNIPDFSCIKVRSDAYELRNYDESSIESKLDINKNIR